MKCMELNFVSLANIFGVITNRKLCNGSWSEFYYVVRTLQANPPVFKLLIKSYLLQSVLYF